MYRAPSQLPTVPLLSNVSRQFGQVPERFVGALMRIVAFPRCLRCAPCQAVLTPWVAADSGMEIASEVLLRYVLSKTAHPRSNRIVGVICGQKGDRSVSLLIRFPSQDSEKEPSGADRCVFFLRVTHPVLRLLAMCTEYPLVALLVAPATTGCTRHLRRTVLLVWYTLTNTRIGPSIPFCEYCLPLGGCTRGMYQLTVCVPHWLGVSAGMRTDLSLVR